MAKNHNGKFLAFVLALVAFVAVLHYATPLILSFRHELFARFFYLPVVLAGLLFGLRGGIGMAVLVAVIYYPHVLIGWSGDLEMLLDKSLEVVLFFLSGACVGLLADRERRHRERAQKLKALAVLGEAASAVAHEMKNAVIPLRGFLQRLRNQAELKGREESYVEIMDRCADRLEAMIGDMLAFSTDLRPKKEVVKIGGLLRELQEEINEEARMHDVRIRLQFTEEGQTGYLDPLRMKQALHNLVQNAIHACPRGGEVKLAFSSKGKGLMFQVEDNGEGIDPDNIDRICAPFFTTKTNGTGLGLAISKRIVEAHGGSLKFQSSPGVGTRVTVVLPVKPAKSISDR